MGEGKNMEIKLSPEMGEGKNISSPSLYGRGLGGG